MNPEKMEEQLRKSLLKEVVTPAAESWDKLASRLDADLKPSRVLSFRKTYWVAAVLLVLLGLRQFLPTDSNSTQRSINANLPQPETVSSIDSEGSAGIPATSANTTETSSGDFLSRPTVNVPKSILTLTGLKPVVKSEISVVNEAVISSVSADIAEASALDQPGQSIEIPRDFNLKTKQEIVGASDIDSLLDEALKAVAETSSRASKDSVSPMRLLAAAEDELDQSFRAQFFEKLKTQIGKVRLAVATRNE